MMTLNIKSIVSYGRYYPSSADTDAVYWWFSVSDYKVYATEDLITKFHYTTCPEIEQSGMFIPMFKTDIKELEEEYLLTRASEEVQAYRKIKEKNKGTEPDTIFKMFIDFAGLWKSWYAFEYQRLFGEAVKWCNAHNISYVQD